MCLREAEETGSARTVTQRIWRSKWIKCFVLTLYRGGESAGP